MHQYSHLAPQRPTGPGTSLSHPFRALSIPHGYNLLDRLYFESSAGRCKVRYDRVGSKSHPSLPHPVDHYVLFEGDLGSKDTKGKLMDFYIYAYSDNPHRDDDLPAGLTIIKLDDETRRKMSELVDKNPELKRVFEERALLEINMARAQRGLPPLDSLPQKGSCLVAIFATLAMAGGSAATLLMIIA